MSPKKNLDLCVFLYLEEIKIVYNELINKFVLY